MDYSLLVSIHNIDHAQREPLGSEAQYSADTRRPAPQKALYSTAMESIQGEARRGGTMETDDQWVDLGTRKECVGSEHFFLERGTQLLRGVTFIQQWSQH